MNNNIKSKIRDGMLDDSEANKYMYWTDSMMKDIDEIIKKYQRRVLPNLYPFNSTYEGYACIQNLIDKTMYHNSKGMENKDLLWKDVKLNADTNLLYGEIEKDSFYMGQNLKQSAICLLGVAILCERMIELTNKDKTD